MEFDFDDQNNGNEEKLYEIPGVGGGGLGIITDCEHWYAEAELKQGGNLKEAELKQHFKSAQRCDKCYLDQ